MLIDPGIRDQVLVPLMAFVVIAHYLRVYLMKLVAPTPQPYSPGSPESIQAEIREKCVRQGLFALLCCYAEGPWVCLQCLLACSQMW